MIPDLDEQMKQQQLAGDDVSHLTAGDDDDDSSDGPGSIYSEWSMMDDALLRTEVAEQVKASSTYGTTKIEAQARLAKIERMKVKQQQQQNKDDTGSNKDMTDVSDIDEDQDDDDAFFVNVGNLEMDEGYEDADVAEIDYEELEKKSGKEKAGYVQLISSCSCSMDDFLLVFINPDLFFLIFLSHIVGRRSARGRR
jgi:hypothetical protein